MRSFGGYRGTMDKAILKPRPLDILPVAIAAILAFLPFLNNPGPASSVRIITPQSEYSIPIEVDSVLTVNGAEGSITIAIQNRSARVVEASCPLKICVKTGKISRPGGTIICAPGRVAVIIEGKNDYDAITK